jgi:thioredoxin reductase (NADPH)
MSQPADTRHVVIAGGGAAALTAAIYLGRAGLDPLLLEGQLTGGQAATTAWIENYPGFPDGISGADLTAAMEAQARKWGAEIATAFVERLELGATRQVVHTAQQAIGARAVVITTGVAHRKLGVPGEQELLGRGVSYCATCDGPLYRGRRVVVVGGGDSALEEALYLARFVAEVSVIHRRGELRAVHILQQRALEEKKISFVWHSVVTEILGSQEVTGVRVSNLQNGETSEIGAEGVFVYIGATPNTRFLPPEIATDQGGFVKTDLAMCTSVPGVFAAGDVRAGSIRQLVAAGGDGAIAADSVCKYLQTL